MTSLTATIAAMLLSIGFVTIPAVTAAPTHDTLGHTNTHNLVV